MIFNAMGKGCALARFNFIKMKNILILLSINIFFLLPACKKEDIKKDGTGAIVEKDFVWQQPLTENQWIWSGVVEIPIYGDKFITATHFEANPKLTAFNIFSGKTEWEWDDYIGRDMDSIFLYMHWPYYYENILIFQRGPRSYCIDMETGQTVWKEEADQPYGTHLTGTGEEFLSIGTENRDTMGYEVFYDVVGDIYTGERHPLPLPSFEIWENTGNVGLRCGGGNLFEAKGKSYRLSTYAKYEEHWVITPFLSLYNRTEEKWEYAEKRILPKHLRNTVSNFPVIVDDIVITSVGYHICANDLWTGDSIWAYDCGGNFLSGGFFIHNGRIYAMAEPVGLYCLDLYTGSVIWKQDYNVPGSTSRLTHMNGVVYFPNKGNGRLMAVDMEGGHIIWNIESPDGQSFKEVAVYPGGGGGPPLVLAATYQNAYCYGAVR